MLHTETKRRIDTARDILVGKVPDPKSQVEQITIALIYKFMDDMDAESEELGGKRKFFTGEFARYGWAKLVRSGLGGHETLNLYSESISKMQENPGIPKLFRDIFKSALLPYRDPETLRAFLKIIDDFEYDHSERLGDAFEYLLSVLGSQGDAGQFRTPRHIIDFMVKIVNPKKPESVLDPACGTAGFLISSYKHIMQANTDENGNSTLTPDEKGKLASNFTGYDISPDMVRLSLVNMYLHGFASPNIHEYDTLTSLERWNEYADVILGNPPFMSPKGGIRPHNRFSVQSKRSEVLFVDYMAEHLTPSGRAGIIVPEGIIFQGGTAYKRLRKMLVEDYLVAVVSLPAGEFNPYSGVKTSILILDKFLAKRTEFIGFFKVENDGYNLGAQRKPIDKNDLPQVQEEIAIYLDRVRSGLTVENEEPAHGLIVAKQKIAANGEYNLSGERYREKGARHSEYPLRRFDEVCTLEYGASLPKEKRVVGPYPVVGSNGITGFHNEFLVEGPAVIVGRKGSAGEVTWVQQNCFPIDTTYYVKRADPRESDLRYLYRLLKTLNLPNLRGGAGIPGLNRADVYNTYRIPLPPLEVQKEIVEEIESYQKVIDGARVVVENYKPHIPVDPEWPMVELGNPELFRVEGGGTPRSDVPKYWDGPIAWATLVDLPPSDFVTEIHSTQRSITELGLAESSARLLPIDSIVVSTRATIGRIAISRTPLATNQGFKNIVVQDIDRIVPKYVAFAMKGLVEQMNAWANGGTFKELSMSKFCELMIPLPPLETQRAIVAEIEAEKTLVNASLELVARMDKKIHEILTRLWGEEESAPTEA